MIVKKIKSSKAKGKASSIRDLVDYCRDSKAHDEKVLFSNGLGFFSESHEGQREEMVALACEAVRSKNPVNHYVLSWQEGEHPSEKQVKEAVDIFMTELGLKDHQAIYALHQDTDNLHLHVVINRVHPETLKCVEINKGFDIEAAHRAIARIEHVQGWKSEKNARYQVLENGELGQEQREENKARQPEQRKRDIEQRTGEKSAERIAIEEGAPIIENAKSWSELHQGLAEKGMRYEKMGSGATVFVNEIGVKASSVSRKASLKQLEKKLGAYRPLLFASSVEARSTEPIKARVSGWSEYNDERRIYFEQKRAQKLEQEQRQQQEKKALCEKQKLKRQAVLQGQWRGRGDILNALRSTLAAEQASEKLELKEKHSEELNAWRQRFKPYPDFEQWQRQRKRPDLAEQWRYRGHEEVASIEGEHFEHPLPKDIRAYRAEVVESQVHYVRKRASYSKGREGGGVSFIDKGQRIDIYDWRNRETTLAALQLSAQKWGTFTVTGNDEYKTLCVELAAQHGFRIQNEELQAMIEKEKDRLEAERREAMKLEQLKIFERYAQAVNAQRYRVTSIKMHEDGSKQTFILDKKHGSTQGFEPQQLGQRMPEMVRLQNRGENLYYTPLSEHKHHILIDDMSREKLEKLIEEGYQPTVLLESSLGNYQAVVTISKLGSIHDKDIGNQLSARLNRIYGDVKLLGCIHPHRAPGFENRKPKHQQADGSFPQVKLLRAMQRECSKTFDLSIQLHQQLEEQHQLKEVKKEAMPELTQRPDMLQNASVTAVDAYQRHHKDVMERQQGAVIDPSRVDSMIAVRMRVTGHNQSSIEGVILQCAPALRVGEESRDWEDYARRTAKYAFSAAGDRQAHQLEKYRELWQKLESQHKPEIKKLVQKEMERARGIELLSQEIKQETQKLKSRGPSLRR